MLTTSSAPELLLGVVLTVLQISVDNVKASVVSPGKAPWTHQMDLLHIGGIKAQWKSTSEADGNHWLEMEVTGKTNGYIGVGFSPNGAMVGADIIIGWVEPNGKSYLKDFHGITNGMPILDPIQNYELLSGSENNGWTTIKFKRKYETCDDEHDAKIRNDTMRLIWALGPSDPVINPDGSLEMDYHGNNRGAQSLYIIDDVFPVPFPDEKPEAFPHVKIWDMTMDNNTIDAEHTTYFCKIVKFPYLDKKHHMIGWKPILSPENRVNVHHIVFYECMVPPDLGGTENIFESHTKHFGGRCYTKNMPPEWAKHCVTFLFTWVAGSEGEMFPEHVGSPLGEMHGGATYFMMEVHYDNPTLRKFVDRSGVRIFYTDKLRQHDGGVMLTGYRITPFLLLPPKQENFIKHGICSSECTKFTIPPGGIHIINTVVHGHLYVRKLRMRHFRDGVELPIVAEDNYYDFNYQQSKTLKKEVTILPGDELITECEYNTVKNDRVILGGLSTTQEMCQTFFVYYPRIDWNQCTSQVEFHDFFKALGADSVEGEVLKALNMPMDPSKFTPHQQKFEATDDAKGLEETGDGASFHSLFDNITITSPKEMKGISVGDHLKNIDWHNQTLGKELEKNWQHSKHYAFCSGHGRRRYPLKDYIIPYPTIKKPLVPTIPNVCKRMG